MEPISLSEPEFSVENLTDMEQKLIMQLLDNKTIEKNETKSKENKYLETAFNFAAVASVNKEDILLKKEDHGKFQCLLQKEGHEVNLKPPSKITHTTTSTAVIFKTFDVTNKKKT